MLFELLESWESNLSTHLIGRCYDSKLSPQFSPLPFILRHGLTELPSLALYSLRSAGRPQDCDPFTITWDYRSVSLDPASSVFEPVH